MLSLENTEAMPPIRLHNNILNATLFCVIYYIKRLAALNDFLLALEYLKM